jgi:hypothetical protein
VIPGVQFSPSKAAGLSRSGETSGSEREFTANWLKRKRHVLFQAFASTYAALPKLEWGNTLLSILFTGHVMLVAKRSLRVSALLW